METDVCNCIWGETQGMGSKPHFTFATNKHRDFIKTETSIAWKNLNLSQGRLHLRLVWHELYSQVEHTLNVSSTDLIPMDFMLVYSRLFLLLRTDIPRLDAFCKTSRNYVITSQGNKRKYNWLLRRSKRSGVFGARVSVWFEATEISAHLFLRCPAMSGRLLQKLSSFSANLLGKIVATQMF